MQISQIIKLTQIKTKITLMFEKNDLNFIGVFNFSWLQTSFNVSFVPFILAFTEFLSPSDAFLKICLGDFMKTYLKPLQTFSSLVAYWQALKKTCPKYFSSKLRASHFTTNFILH